MLPFAPDGEGFVEPGAKGDLFDDGWGDDPICYFRFSKFFLSLPILPSHSLGRTCEGEMKKTKKEKRKKKKKDALFPGKNAPGDSINRVAVRAHKIAIGVASVIGHFFKRREFLAECLPIGGGEEEFDKGLFCFLKKKNKFPLRFS